MIILAALLATPAFSDDFSNFDHRHCQVVDDTKFCVEFEPLPFGPGFNGEAFLVSSEANPIVGPVPEISEPLGKVYSQDGIIIEFKALNITGKFDETGLDIYNLLIRFKKE